MQMRASWDPDFTGTFPKNALAYRPPSLARMPEPRSVFQVTVRIPHPMRLFMVTTQSYSTILTLDEVSNRSKMSTSTLTNTQETLKLSSHPSNRTLIP
jgi:hypothetical protein